MTVIPELKEIVALNRLSTYNIPPTRIRSIDQPKVITGNVYVFPYALTEQDNMISMHEHGWSRLDQRLVTEILGSDLAGCVNGLLEIRDERDAKKAEHDATHMSRDEYFRMLFNQIFKAEHGKVQQSLEF